MKTQATILFFFNDFFYYELNKKGKSNENNGNIGKFNIDF